MKEETIILKVISNNEKYTHIVINTNWLLSYNDCFKIKGEAYKVKSPKELGTEAIIVPYGKNGFKYLVEGPVKHLKKGNRLLISSLQIKINFDKIFKLSLFKLESEHLFKTFKQQFL